MKQSRVFTIKEINKYIRMKLDADVTLSDVWLQGEISNFIHHSSGHMYFTLKDKDSRIKSVMFASHNAKLSFIPKEGAKVLARGNISVFERDGQYQFYATNMQPDGLGHLFLAFEQLKNKLEQEGLFAESRKRPLPRYPSAIGIITSPTGAAVQDIITTLRRRYPIIPIYIYPVLVQGEQAAASIARAIEVMNDRHMCDVLIVGRGGGSLEELWAFNEEVVARAIANSHIPIISAVGHETDFTIADFVADLRAATPTAAAELVVPHVDNLREQFMNKQQRLLGAMQQRYLRYRDRLSRLTRSPFFVQPHKYMLDQAQRLDFLQLQLQNSMRQFIQAKQEQQVEQHGKLQLVHPKQRKVLLQKQLENLQYKLNQSTNVIINRKQMQLISSMKQLDALSPLKVMARGYGLVYDRHQHRLVTTTSRLQAGDNIEVRLADGTIHCLVESVEEERGEGHE
ncbi:exodeoxyribonuclease VII large subunit [Paenibacillus yanchengensis]|uniref:Exodeoxyribonuclease 7 large subunit n=1 Tax=Paenibacillus yanchengensis TaxID=2035833 RepID=A0ABW4YK97_9BACL